MRQFAAILFVLAAAIAAVHFSREQPALHADNVIQWRPTPRSPAYVGDPVNPRADWHYAERAYPLDVIPDQARLRARKQMDRLAEFSRFRDKASAASIWRLVGPVGFNSNIEPTWGTQSGRVRAMAIDPSNSNRLFLGTASGGVWRSTDGGVSWTPLTDTEDSLSIGAIAIDPQNSNVIYAGTGEANGIYYSAGILKSTNGGATWTTLAQNTFGRGAIASLLVSPTNSNIVIACVMNGSLLYSFDVVDPTGQVGGVYRSTNGGSTFTRTANQFCRELRAVPNDFNTMYFSATFSGASNGLHRSTDGGQNWSPVTTAVNGNNIGRLAIGLSQDGSNIYLGGEDGQDLVVFQESTDSGATWSTPRRVSVTNNPNGPGTPPYCEQQCFYDNVIAVDPFNANRVFYGGVGLYRSDNGGQTFTTVGNNNIGGGPLHVDHHVFLFDPAISGTAYSGNDGGIYKTTNGGTTWTALSSTISTMQHYNLALHPTDANTMFAGNQDNGTTRRTNSDTWTEVMGGDGGYTLIDPTNPQTIYGSTVFLDFNRSDNNGGFFVNVTPPLTNADFPAFIAPVAMDPNNPSVLYAGSSRVWRTTNRGNNWTAVSGQLNASMPIRNLAVAPSDSTVVYAVTAAASVHRSVQSGANFANVTSAPLPNRTPTEVAVHPTDANTAYVTYSGFDDATPATPGHVFKTVDGGNSWSNVSSGLPNIPFTSMAIRPDSPEEVYAGSDVGLFISLDGGASWQKMTNGLPNAGIADIEVNQTTDLLAVATHGRSVWVTSLSGGGGGNQPPIAANDSATVMNGGTVTMLDSGESSLLANDSDPESGMLTLQSDPVTPPANGSVSLNANGTFSYTHNGSATSSDQFVYQVCDDGMPGMCAMATVTITITSDGGGMTCSMPGLSIPDVTPGISDTITVTGGDPIDDLDVSLMVSHTFVGDLEIRLTHDDTGTQSTLIMDPGGGNCGNDNINAVFDDDAAQLANDQCAQAPSAAISGTLRSLTALSAFNGESLNGTWTLTIIDAVSPDGGTLDNWCLVADDNAPINTAPTATDDAIDVLAGGTATQLTSGQPSLLANDSDPDMDMLAVDTVPVAAPANGSVNLAADGTFSYTHDGSATTTDQFSYQVCDDGIPRLCDTASVLITVSPGMLCNAPGAAIPDADTLGLDDVMNVTQGGLIGDLDVSVVITHTFIGDLRLRLTHEESGAAADLLVSGTGCPADNIDALFDDEAAASAQTECGMDPALGGDVRPATSLGAFDLEDLSGTWTFNVADLAGLDIGTLDEWCLIPTLAPDDLFGSGFEVLTP